MSIQAIHPKKINVYNVPNQLVDILVLKRDTLTCGNVVEH